MDINSQNVRFSASAVGGLRCLDLPLALQARVVAKAFEVARGACRSEVGFWDVGEAFHIVKGQGYTAPKAGCYLGLLCALHSVAELQLRLGVAKGGGK